MTDTHFPFQLSHIAKKSGRLLRGQACHVNEKSLDRLAFVGKKVLPAVKLLVDERKEGERQTLENAIVQCALQIVRRLVGDCHTCFPV